MDGGLGGGECWYGGEGKGVVGVFSAWMILRTIFN